MGETYYPLHTFVCHSCFLVQLASFEGPEKIFNHDYAYFSSFSKSWVNHARQYTEDMISRLKLSPQAHIAEVASNDGYLLRHFHEKGFKVTGIEPASGCAEAAKKLGIHSEIEFWGQTSSKKITAKRGQADLMAANNVLAHVPDIHDFVSGFRFMLKDEGVLTFEFPHLLQLMKLNQFDTIYHEHFSYLSLSVVQEILTKNNLRAFDVSEISTHGGSLRVFVCHTHSTHQEAPGISQVLKKELDYGLNRIETYQGFQKSVVAVKNQVWRFLIDANQERKTVVGYGAAAKGNTLLNYCGVGPDHLNFVVDLNPAKQNTLLPGSRVPVLSAEEIKKIKPDYIFILPWNLKAEIVNQLSYVREWGGKFVIAIPELEVF